MERMIKEVWMHNDRVYNTAEECAEAGLLEVFRNTQNEERVWEEGLNVGGTLIKQLLLQPALIQWLWEQKEAAVLQQELEEQEADYASDPMPKPTCDWCNRPVLQEEDGHYQAYCSQQCCDAHSEDLP